MTYSYDLSTLIGQLRLRIPDNISEEDALFTDEELQVFLNNNFDDILKSLIEIYYCLSARYSTSSGSSSSFQMGTLKISEDASIGNKYLELAKRLEDQLASGTSSIIPFIYTSGIYKTEKDINDSNTNIIKPVFKLNQFDVDGLIGDSDTQNDQN